jgi:hypothetical protein
MRRNKMARRNVEEVETVETEEVAVEATESAEEKPKKEKKGPARGDLPEGYVTPVQLAKELTDKKMHTNRQGEVAEVAPQMVYSYIKNASKEDPFPIETITDSIGKERQVVKLEAGLAWWERKNARAAERKANAAEKAQKKAERAAAKENEAEAEVEETDAVEAE